MSMAASTARSHAALAPLRKQLRAGWTSFGAAAAQDLRDQGQQDLASALAVAVTSGSASQWEQSQVPAQTCIWLFIQDK